MKNFRRPLAAGALALAFTLPAFAGEMQCPVAPPTTAPTSAATQGHMDTPRGNMDNGVMDNGAAAGTAPAALAEATLGLLHSVLTLL